MSDEETRPRKQMESNWLTKAVAFERISRCTNYAMLDAMEKQLDNQLSMQNDRTKSLEGKAMALFASVGIASSFTGAYGIKAASNFQAFDENVQLLLGIGIGLVAFSGVLTALCAALVVRVSSRMILNDAINLNEEAIELSEQNEGSSTPLQYRWLIIRGIWEAGAEARIRNNAKSKWLMTAQFLFLSFVFFLLLITSSVSIILLLDIN